MPVVRRRHVVVAKPAEREDRPGEPGLYEPLRDLHRPEEMVGKGEGMNAEAKVTRVGRRSYSVSSQNQVALPRELALGGKKVRQMLVEEPGRADLRKGDLILRRVR